jgi:predicted helicase
LLPRGWDLSRPDDMVRNDRKHLHPHQIAARDAVRAGFVTGDRGKLILACGTGKTFDVIICDEAHRTTWVTVAGQDESAFVRVHDDRCTASVSVRQCPGAC